MSTTCVVVTLYIWTSSDPRDRSATLVTMCPNRSLSILLLLVYSRPRGLYKPGARVQIIVEAGSPVCRGDPGPSQGPIGPHGTSEPQGPRCPSGTVRVQRGGRV